MKFIRVTFATNSSVSQNLQVVFWRFLALPGASKARPGAPINTEQSSLSFFRSCWNFFHFVGESATPAIVLAMRARISG
jgi:hypothetical protein